METKDKVINFSKVTTTNKKPNPFMKTKPEEIKTVETSMTNTLTVFTNEELNANVRVVEINGEPWFVAIDVCKALELTNPTVVINRLDEDERAKFNLGRSSTHGGGGDTNIVNEYGLYNLILKSRKPEAKKFSRWITHEVLPSIRKTGSYSGKPMTEMEIIAACANKLVEQEKQMIMLQKSDEQQNARLAALETQAKYMDKVTTFNHVDTIDSIKDINVHLNSTDNRVTAIEESLSDEKSPRIAIKNMINYVVRRLGELGYDTTDAYRIKRAEFYKDVEDESGASLKNRLTRQKNRMINDHVSATKIAKLSYADIIDADKNLWPAVRKVISDWYEWIDTLAPAGQKD